MGDATDNKVLSQLMLLQGTLVSMPTDESMSRFVSRGFKSVPGVSSLNVCVRGAVAEKNDLCPSCNYRWGEGEDNFDHLCKRGDYGNTKRFPIRTADRLYGFVVFTLNDTPDAFTPYEPYLQNIVNVIALSIDHKQAEEKIKASLLEKETMLKEIHHRVKNNLQVISSLLDLQSSYLKDEKAKEMLQNSMDRVSTMAKIHTMLYQSEDMSRVDFGGFIRDLSSRLRQSYGISGSPVGVNVNVSDVSLTIETSIPCGLILNELVSNALKHAFPEGKGGEVYISMKSEGDQFTLTVQDNGIGFSAAVDFQDPRSLGLELVSLLVRQVNGTIDLEVDGGTKFTITFPIANKRG